MPILQSLLYAELLFPPPATRLDDDCVGLDWHRLLADVCFTHAQWQDITAHL